VVDSKAVRVNRERLDKAMTVAGEAAEAVRRSAGEVGCRAGCGALLQSAVDRAEGEVKEARADYDRRLAGAELAGQQTVAAARTALGLLKPVAKAAPYGWVLDLLMAALWSIAGNGMAVLLLVFATGRRSQETVTCELVGVTQQTVSRPVDVAVVPVRVARVEQRKPVERVSVEANARRGVGSVKVFVLECLFPADAASVTLSGVFVRYKEWCASKGFVAVSVADFGDEFAVLAKRARLKPVVVGKDVVFHGVIVV
jgi:hypothetical protein